MILNLLFIILGLILLIKGADFLVDGSSEVAKKFHIPEIIIGLTIVSIGTSLPELMVSLTSALKNHSDLAIGNVVGSNISNLFFILGACAAIRPLKFKDKTITIEIPLVIFLTALLYIFGNNGNQKIITKTEGLILLIFCSLFILYNIIIAKTNSKKSNNNMKGLYDDLYSTVDIEYKNVIREDNTVKSMMKIIIGVIALKFGGDFIVNNASSIASSLGVSEKMISLTVVSFCTSLPEFITSITATLKNEVDMAIGNIMGSNVFNIVLIIGVTAIINPIAYSISYNRDIIIFLGGMIALAIIPFIGEKNKISRWGGIGYVISYISYMASIIYVNLF